jgi:NADH-quinone oxidoreductase subunit A
MENQYIGILVLIVLAAGFVITMLTLSIVLGPKRHSEMKDDPFECGTIGTGNPQDRFGVKFYLVAMVFILFDIEIVFLYPWAVQLRALGWQAFFAMLSFLLVLTVGLVYVWKRGVLDWD